MNIKTFLGPLVISLLLTVLCLNSYSADLNGTLSNSHSITITQVDYYETQGKLLKGYIDAPVTIGPSGVVR